MIASLPARGFDCKLDPELPMLTAHHVTFGKFINSDDSAKNWVKHGGAETRFRKCSPRILSEFILNTL